MFFHFAGFHLLDPKMKPIKAGAFAEVLVDETVWVYEVGPWAAYFLVIGFEAFWEEVVNYVSLRLSKIFWFI